MNYRTIISKPEMESAIKQGIEKIAGIVKRTLGPGGLPIILERNGQALDGSPLGPMITKDGVTVAENCQDADPTIDLVIQSVKDICQKTNKVAGDGTTSAIVLGEAILKEAFRELDADPTLNPQLVRESIEEAAKIVLNTLSQQVESIVGSDPDASYSKIEDVATLSANGDREIGRIIREAFQAVGAEGVITVDEGHTAHTTIRTVDGFQIKRGAEAQDRFFNNSDNTRFEAKDCRVIICNSALRSYTELLPAFKVIGEQAQKEALAANRKPAMPPILVVADDFSQEVIQWLLINRAEAGLSVCAVKSPHVSDVRTGMLDDMAVMLGGLRLGNGNRSIQAITFDDIGIAESIQVDRYTTTFYGGQGTEEAVLERINSLKARKAAADNPHDAGILADRIGALANGVALIGVGGTTEMEIKERYHRIEDALNAARAAVEEGIIPGGGIALAKVAEHMAQTLSEKASLGENFPYVGTKILSQALMAPFYQICKNIEVDGPATFEKIKARVMSGEKVTFDARQKRVVDAWEAGIIDPFKVCRTAFENAVSIAALLSTCGGGIIYSRKL